MCFLENRSNTSPICNTDILSAFSLFPFDVGDIPLFLIPHLLSLPSFCLPFRHYVIYLLHNFIYSSVFAILLCPHEHHQYLSYPSGFWVFLVDLKKNNFLFVCFNLLSGSGLRSLGLAIVQRACTGTNGIPGKTWWDEELLYIKK